MKMRSVKSVVDAVRTVEGAGFVVRRPFPVAGREQFDPFLLLDHMGPVDLKPGEAKGAPDHPHRGFETVTYILEGALEHKDSVGNRGLIQPGGVQWMTAGAGVVHSEMPSTALQRDGGRMHGFQLWVNLPRRDKLMHPRYQDLPVARIPTAQSDDGRVQVRVIAGESLGARAVIETRTPIMYVHATLQPGGVLDQAVPAGFNVFAYVVDGSIDAGGNSAGGAQTVFFSTEGEGVRITNRSPQAANVLIIGGMPLREPVARYGPFVMNSRSELIQAFDDFEQGRMGTIPPALS